MSSRAAPSAPIGAGERITTLDAVRGVAVMGILTMNAVSYGLPAPAYFNLDSAGSDTWLDWLIGGAGEVLFDQKFLGLFSLLFGAGIVLFADRAEAKGRRPGWFSLWRNLLLLFIGLAHMALWDGDILVLYAVCSPLVILLRRRRPATLLAVGTLLVLSSAAVAAIVQSTIDDPATQLAGLWYEGDTMADEAGTWFIYNFFSTGLGMMLIGVALYRLDVLNGRRSTDFYKRMAVAGLAVGLPLAGLGLAVTAADGFSGDVALLGAIPNTFATIPAALGYVAVITLWNAAADSPLRRRVRAAGRMALTNYLTQTVIGIVVLRGIFDAEDLTRSWLAVFILSVWALQLWWSKAWLDRFRYGPAEWLWRMATYRRWQPLRVNR